MKNFQECPFFVDDMHVHSIYRSLSPGNFFITFKHNNVISKPIIISTPYNPFNECICSSSTVWHPSFEQMKTLLILGVKVKEPFTEEKRKQFLNSEKEVFTFGTYDFNEDCKYTVVDGKYTFKRKTYKFVIDNLSRTIRIIHIKEELQNLLASISANDSFLLRLVSVHHPFTNEQLKEYSTILKWGSGVTTFYDADEYYQSGSIAAYGLCFNCHINWGKEVLSIAEFELNHYQATMYDDKAFPLSIEHEIKNRISIITSWGKAPEYYSEDMMDEYYDKLTDTINAVSEASTQSFDFPTLEEFICFTNSCKPIYSLNRPLYKNFLHLLQSEGIDIITDIFDRIKTAHHN